MCRNQGSIGNSFWTVLAIYIYIYMIGNNSLFSSITNINGGKVIFRDNLKGKIVTVGNIRDKSSPSIEKVFLVNSLKNNLLSISQLCDKGYKIVTNHTSCLILENDKVIYIEIRKQNVYKIKIDACMRIKSCLVIIINDFFFCIEDYVILAWTSFLS